MTELLEAIRSHERAGRSNPAFDDGHRSLSWGDTVQAIENTIGELEQSGLGRSPVGLDIDHSTGAAILLVALIEAGIPVVPLPPYFNEAQRLAALGRAGASACISGFPGSPRRERSVCATSRASTPQWSSRSTS